jgi:hypothetical protein
MPGPFPAQERASCEAGQTHSGQYGAITYCMYNYVHFLVIMGNSHKLQAQSESRKSILGWAIRIGALFCMGCSPVLVCRHPLMAVRHPGGAIPCHFKGRSVLDDECNNLLPTCNFLHT